MEVPCVRVPREDGEATRRALADADLIDDEYEIAVEDGALYVPITDPRRVADRLESADEREFAFDIVTRPLDERETQTTPADVLGFDPSYERLGTAVLLDEDDTDRAREIADAVLESDLPVETVLNKASKVKGETRVRDWELLAGEDAEVVHREYGCEYVLDLAEVYFSPRLATERHRVVERVEAGERAFDMFAGVGPFVVPFAKRGAECVGVDINPDAIEYLRENARRNDVDDRVTAICTDVRRLVGSPPPTSERSPHADDDLPARDDVLNYEDWADRIVMNLPHSADEFLDTAVAIAGDDCVLHYYDIQHEDDPFGPGERAIRDAAEPDYEVSVETRHTVRSYAPHEVNVCLDVRLERAG